MRIETFKLINFDSLYWQNSSIFDLLNNTNTIGKVQKTMKIIKFLQSKIISGDAKVDSEAGLYILNVKDENKDVTSIICSMDYNENKVFFPNENIHKDKLSIYKDLLAKYKLQTNPVLTFYRGGESIKELTKDIICQIPKIKACIYGTKYTLWKVQNYNDISNIKNSTSKIDRIYIADGHHRFSLFQNIASKTNAKIMISLTDAESVCLKSCHRAIIGHININWLKELKKYCFVEKVGIDSANNGITIIQNTGDIYKVLLKNEIIEEMQLYKAVDKIIIQKALGVSDHSKLFPLPGSVGVKDYQKIFDLYSDSSILIFIPEINISDFFKVVDNGEKLPPSSTWFEPKIVDGFLMKSFG